MYFDPTGHKEGDWWDLWSNTKAVYKVVTDKEERKEAFEVIDTYGSKSDKILAIVSSGTAVIMSAAIVAVTAVYTAPIVASSSVGTAIATGATGVVTTIATNVQKIMPALNSAATTITNNAPKIISQADVVYNAGYTVKDLAQGNFAAVPNDLLYTASSIIDNRYITHSSGRNKNVKANNVNGTKGVGEANYTFFNKTHKNSLPIPKGKGPNGGRLQSHHGLQKQWAEQNLKKYGYDADLAPTVTIETGKGFPHTSISNAQNIRRNARVTSGNGKWSSSLQDELQYIVDDFTNAGFSKGTIKNVMEQQYKMLDKLGIPYERIGIK